MSANTKLQPLPYSDVFSWGSAFDTLQVSIIINLIDIFCVSPLEPVKPEAQSPSLFLLNLSSNPYLQAIFSVPLIKYNVCSKPSSNISSKNKKYK